MTLTVVKDDNTVNLNVGPLDAATTTLITANLATLIEASSKTLRDYGPTVTQTTVDAMIADVGYVRLGKGAYNVVSDTNIPATLYIADNGYFNVQPGVTLTIQARYNSPKQYIFRGTGTVLLQHIPGSTGEDVRHTHLSHWGVFPSGSDPGDQAPLIQKVIDAFGTTREGRIQADNGNYWMKSGCIINRGVIIQGNGERLTVWKIDGDGFIPFTSGGIEARLWDANFEINGSTVRTSPMIRFVHDECQALRIRGGNSFCTVQIAANYCMVQDVSGIFGSAPASGSSIVNIQSGTGNSVDGVRIETSTVGPTNLVDVGGNGTGTVVGTWVNDVYHRTNGGTVRIKAEAGNVVSTIITNARNVTGLSATDGISIYATGTYSVTDTTIDDITMSGTVNPAFRVNNSGTGEIRAATVGLFRAAGSSGDGAALSNSSSGTISNLTFSSGWDARTRTNSITTTGTGITYRNSIESDDVFAGWNGSATDIASTATIDNGALVSGLYRVTSSGALGTFPPGFASTDSVLLFVQRYASGTSTQIMRKAFSSTGGTWYRRCISNTFTSWGSEKDSPAFSTASFVGTGAGSATITYNNGQCVELSLPTDTAAQIVLTNVFGRTLAIAGNSSTSARGLIHIRTATTPFQQIVVGPAPLAVSSSALTGTTGTAGNITVSAQAGALHIENREGSTRSYCLTLQ